MFRDLNFTVNEEPRLFLQKIKEKGSTFSQGFNSFTKLRKNYVDLPVAEFYQLQILLIKAFLFLFAFFATSFSLLAQPKYKVTYRDSSTTPAEF